MKQGLLADDLADLLTEYAATHGKCRDLYGLTREFFHDVCNRLSSINVSLYLAKRTATEDQRPLWYEMDQTYRALEQLVGQLQTICRPCEHQPVQTCVGRWLETRRPVWSQWFETRQRTLGWDAPPGSAPSSFDPHRLLAGLDALVAWRAAEGPPDAPARLRWGSQSGICSIEWSEDDDGRNQSVDGREGRAVSLALPLLAKIMAGHDGRLSVSRDGVFHVKMSWPARAESLASA